LEMLIAGCLAKSRDDRWQSMHDVHRQLQWIGNSSSLEPEPLQTGRKRHGFMAYAILGVLLGALVASLAFRRTSSTEKDATYFSIFAPNKPLQWPAPAISPDGMQVAFVGADPSG